MTTIELMVVAVILAVALTAMSKAIASSTRLVPSNRTNTIALHAAQNVVEQVRALPLLEIFPRYNADPADDPALGDSPGAFFPVAGLDPIPGDPDGFVGAIEFPTIGGELREDVADRDLGMPRDLNMDGVQDNLDHAGDYGILPFRVVLQWRSSNGQTGTLTLYSSVTAP